jgi:hypothetical protein
MAVPKSDVSTAMAVLGLEIDRNGVRETAIRSGAKASAVARKHAHTHTAAVNSRECTPNIMVQKFDGIVMPREKDMIDGS